MPKKNSKKEISAALKKEYYDCTKKLEESFQEISKGLSLLEIDCLFESNAIENEKSEEALEDAIEAWKYAKENMGKIDVAYVLEIHRLLMKRLRPDITGKFRTCDVWIGGQCKWFVSVALLKEQLEKWIKKSRMLIERSKDFSISKKENVAKILHIELENLHFAVDGNGRCGRILYQVHRLLLGLPIKAIEASTKYEKYYPWFRSMAED